MAGLGIEPKRLVRPFPAPRLSAQRDAYDAHQLAVGLLAPSTGKTPTFVQALVFDYWREMRRFASIFRLLKAAHGGLTKEQRDLFERALVNGNSIIVPLSTVREFHQERVMLTPRLLVQTSDGRELMFGPSGYLEVTTPS